MQTRLAASVAVFLGLTACGPPEFSERPNIVLITVDTLRADRLGAYGYARAKTPNIDRLAREGTLFRSASTVIPRTSQSIASLFSSLYPHEHGSLEIGTGPRDDVLLAPQLFQAAGYATAGISGNGAASRTQRFERGFEHFVGWTDIARGYRLWSDPPPRVRRSDLPHFIGRGAAVTSEALNWIGQEREGPYFLWLLYMDPHWFYNPPPPFRDVIDWNGFDYYEKVGAWKPKNATIYFNLNGTSAEHRDEFSKLYDAEIAYTDSALGPLLEKLRESERPTLIVFTSDHGESLGEHGYYYEHGDFVWETTMRVPLILHAPGVVPAGLELALPATLLDVLPTLLSLSGVAAPEGARFSGRDLSGQIFAGDPDAQGERVIFGESGSALIPQNPHRSIGGTLTQRRIQRYVRDGRWLGLRDREHGFQLFDAEADPYLRTDVAEREPEQAKRMRERVDRVSVLGSRWRTARDARWKLVRVPGIDETHDRLYDLEIDPGELEDVAAANPKVRGRLAAALDTWLATIPQTAGGSARELDAEGARELEEQLRSLGYVD